MSIAQTDGNVAVITTKAALEQKVLYQPSVSEVVSAALMVQKRSNAAINDVEVISTINSQSNSVISAHTPVIGVSVVKQPTHLYVAQKYLPGDQFVNPFFHWANGRLASISYESGETETYNWSGDLLLSVDISSNGTTTRTVFNWVDGLLQSASESTL